MSRQFTDNQVLDIRKRRATGESAAELAREYGVTRQAISAIVTGLRYQDLPVYDNPKSKAQKRAVTDEDLRVIFRRWADGDNSNAICADYGISPPTLSHYLTRLTDKRPPGPEWRRVEPWQGAKLRDALLQIARGHEDPQGLAHEVLGIEEKEDA